MNPAPQISVIMPVFNAERFLRQTIDSILSQTFSDFELIIINDGSSDKSVEIIEGYTDERIRLIHNERNIGITATLNKAISLCKAELIARMDADDIMHPNRLQLQFEKIHSDNEIAVLATRINFMNEDGDVTGEWNTDSEAVSEGQIRAIMPRTNCIAHPTVMMRKDIALKYGYRAEQKNTEDWDLWLRILGDGLRIAKLSEALLDYRVHTTSVTAIHKKEESLQVRLMRARRNFLVHQLKRFRINGFFMMCLVAQLRNFVKHTLDNKVVPFGRGVKRVFTYAPGHTLGEQEKLKRALQDWKGNNLFLFPYLHEGGAEQVHADILNAVNDENALVLITGFSSNKSYLPRFEEHAQVLEIPNLANHPFTGKHAVIQIADALNNRENVNVFGANSEFFFELVPVLSEKIKKHYLIHAFKYQPDGNALHKSWLRYINAISSYIFISHESQKEFEKLCFYNNVPKAGRDKLMFIANAVHEYAEPTSHKNLRVLFVGRDSAEKRVELFLRIAKNVFGAQPNIEFSVVGMNAKKSSSNVQFFGSITDKATMNKLYSEHDVLLLTSNREGFPLVIMEAMAHGLAIGSTPVGDIPNRLNESFATITTSIDDDIVVNDLSEFVLKLGKNKTLLNSMKTNAYNEAKSSFSWAKFERAYRSLFEK